MAVAGWKNDPVFDTEVFGAIHQLTKGVPAAINVYCDRLLMFCMLNEVHHIRMKDVSNLTSASMDQLDLLEETRLNRTETTTDSHQDVANRSAKLNSKIAEIETVLQAGLDARQAAGDFSGHKGFSSYGRFMVE